MSGTIILKYRTETLLNSGLLGDVYTGTHIETKEKVIIRCLNFQSTSNIEIKLRIKNDLYLLSQINHPCIAKVYDYSESGGNLFIITEFIQGKSLKKYRVEFPDFFTQIIQEGFYSSLLDIFSMVHGKGIIHAHINPSNILVTPGNKIKAVNFGLSEFSETKIENAPKKNNENLLAICYSSPEQLQNKVISNKSDIYSLGALLFFLLKGKNPYEGITSGEILIKKILSEPFPLDVRNTEGIPEKYIAIIKKATEKNSEDRFLNCEQFKAAFNFPAKAVTTEKKPEKKTETVLLPPPIVNKQKPVSQQTIKKIQTENLFNKSPNTSKNLTTTKGVAIGLGVVMLVFGILLSVFINSSKKSDNDYTYKVQENQYKIDDSLLIQQEQILDSINKSNVALIADSVYEKVDQMPEFPGGKDGFKNWLKKTVHYPKEAKQSNIHGEVIITFVIDEKGRAANIKIKKDIGGGCGEEAAKVISRMPGWKPGKQNEKNVKVRFEVPVSFNANN